MRPHTQHRCPTCPNPSKGRSHRTWVPLSLWDLGLASHKAGELCRDREAQGPHGDIGGVSQTGWEADGVGVKHAPSCPGPGNEATENSRPPPRPPSPTLSPLRGSSPRLW